MSRITLILSAIVLALLVGVGGVLYAFGTPSAPTATPASRAEDSPEQAPESPADGIVQSAQPADIPAPDPASPLAIQIPGCVCHSDDPELVEEHANYRMNQCAGCHAGAVPTGQ